MAELPLDPTTQDEMFPDTLVEPFITSPEVAEVAAEIIAKWDEFTGLRDALESEVHPLQIAYVLETKKFDISEGEWTIHTVVNTTKASPLWRSLSGYDVVIAYRQAFWDAHEVDERLAFLHHGLSHIDTFPKIGIRQHPVEGFPWTFRRYGPLSHDDRQFVRAGSLWQEDHPSEPVQLRALPPETDAPAGTKSRGKDAATAAADRVDEAVEKTRAEMDQVDTMVCVGSNHVPGCAHMGGEIPPKRAN